MRYDEISKEKATPQVSIIVPIYNAGQYLRVCLDSLINQTLKDIEIILVLDMPTDGSDKVAEEYALQDPRIKLVYNKTNLHTGLSRNEGIKHATGEYIGFSDHDDYCEDEMFEKLYEKAKKESADVLISNFYDEDKISRFEFAFPEGYSHEEFQKNAFEALISGQYSQKNTKSFNNMNVIWNQIYRREFILANSINFPDNKTLTMEDVLFSLKVYHFAKKVVYLPATYYHHVNTNNNTYNNYGYRSILKIIPFIETIYNFLHETDIWNKYKEQFAICTLKRLYSSYLNELKFNGLKCSPKFFRMVRSNETIQNILVQFCQNKTLIRQFPFTKKCFFQIIHK